MLALGPSLLTFLLMGGSAVLGITHVIPPPLPGSVAPHFAASPTSYTSGARAMPETSNLTNGWQNDSALGGHPHPAGVDGTMTFDAADGYVLWFGVRALNQFTARGYPETWTFRGGAWTNLTGSLTSSPPALQGVGLAYDAADGYVVLFGGFDVSVTNGTYSHPSETWEYRAGSWTNVTATAGNPPPGEFHPAMTYDAAARFVLLAAFARSPSGNSTFETWSFSAGQWHDLTGSSGPQPQGREQSGLAYDAADSESVLFGGNYVHENSQGFQYNDTWVFHNGSWANASQPGAAAPQAGGDLSISSTVGGHVVLFGGFGGSGCYQSFRPSCGVNRTWVFFDGYWSDLSSVIGGGPPPIQTDDPMAWDPIDGYGVLLDGNATTWLLQWNLTLPALSLTSSATGVAVGGGLRFTVAEFGGTPPYNLTLCPGFGACSKFPALPAASSMSWSARFPLAGNWTVYGRLVDANGSTTVTGVVIRAAGVGGPLNATLAVHPTAGDTPFNLSLWVNVTGGAPPYEITVEFGDGSNGSAISHLRLSHTYACGTPAPNTTDYCEYSLSAYVVDSIGESWSSASIPLAACTSVPPTSNCTAPGPPPSAPPGGAVAQLHLADLRYDGGYAMLVLGGGISALTSRRRRRESAEEARSLLRQLEAPPSAPGRDDGPR
ncbi:MAG: hypothetical protein L3K09_04445 [Thermoplasmata archaeon]|nr:hypothetical protein [Thermoplasmata archaeon]